MSGTKTDASKAGFADFGPTTNIEVYNMTSFARENSAWLVEKLRSMLTTFSSREGCRLAELLLAPHYMVDLETLDDCPSATIVSIGLVKFHVLEQFPMSSVEIVVAASGQLELGRTTNKKTWDWWMKQNEEVRQTLAKSISGKSTATDVYVFDGQDVRIRDVELLFDTLTIVNKFFEADQRSDPAPYVWCRGNSFDFPILKDAYKASGRQLPWDFRRELDERTLSVLFDDVDVWKNPNKHNARHDAVYQAESVRRRLLSLFSVSGLWQSVYDLYSDEIIDWRAREKKMARAKAQTRS